MRTTDDGEDVNIEEMLVERVAQHDTSLETASVNAGEEQDAGDIQLVYHRCAGF